MKFIKKYHQLQEKINNLPISEKAMKFLNEWM
jgi:hypothetical protein